MGHVPPVPSTTQQWSSDEGHHFTVSWVKRLILKGKFHRLLIGGGEPRGLRLRIRALSQNLGHTSRFRFTVPTPEPGWVPPALAVGMVACCADCYSIEGNFCSSPYSPSTLTHASHPPELAPLSDTACERLNIESAGVGDGIHAGRVRQTKYQVRCWEVEFEFRLRRRRRRRRRLLLLLLLLLLTAPWPTNWHWH
jgi:hypothetical protein